ncbi:hypothetical protein [Streptomyces uncialis]|uniref:hypothetical protein n=1 Tax=Streptomyces uncialis TaxID=1048205 RepID=UPI003864152F|nr:hypothetical protein OG924_03000 [Streptomyces uncialis]
MSEGVPRWNPETQRWERDPGPQGAPPAPGWAGGPGQAGGPGWGGGSGWGGGPTPGGGPGWGRGPVIALVAGGVLAVAGVVLWLTADRDGGGGDESRRTDSTGYHWSPPATGGSQTSPTGGGASLDSPDGTGGTNGTDGTTPGGQDTAPGGGESPSPGFVRVTEPTRGFTIAVPEGWEHSLEDGSVFYRSPDQRGLVQVFGASGADPLEAVGLAERPLKSREDYRRLALGRVDSGPENPSGDAAELHYSYRNEDVGGVRECVDRVFTGTDGKQHAVLACSPPGAAGLAARRVLDTALADFAP